MSDVKKPELSNPEEKLIEYQEQVDRIRRWAGVGTWEWSVETGQFDIDLAFLCRYGYTMEELTPFTTERWLTILHPDDVRVTMQWFGDLLSGKSEQYNYLFRIRSKTDDWIMFHARGGVEKRDAEGNPLLFAGTIQDVSNLKPADHRDQLLSAVNEAANVLLGSGDEAFGLKIWRVLDLLGRAAEVDRVYVWKNRQGEDGRLYTTQVHEWSLGAEPQSGNEFTVDIAFEEAIPTWEKALTSGECINNLVRLMPQA